MTIFMLQLSLNSGSKVLYTAQPTEVNHTSIENFPSKHNFCIFERRFSYDKRNVAVYLRKIATAGIRKHIRNSFRFWLLFSFIWFMRYSGHASKFLQCCISINCFSAFYLAVVSVFDMLLVRIQIAAGAYFSTFCCEVVSSAKSHIGWMIVDVFSLELSKCLITCTSCRKVSVSHCTTRILIFQTGTLRQLCRKTLN